jgi:hypothetical protein
VTEIGQVCRDLQEMLEILLIDDQGTAFGLIEQVGE